MDDWVVTLVWNGDPGRIQALLRSLLHLQPTIVEGQSRVRLAVRAISAPEAERYVQNVLVREQFSGAAKVIGVEARQ